MVDGRVLEQHHRGVPRSSAGRARIRGSVKSTRATARRAIPEPLRRDVRLLGRLLGQVIAEQGGDDPLRDVEEVRRLVMAARHSAPDERRAEGLVASWSIERAEQVARAFTCYFHLANLAEEHQRVRALRERDQGPDPLPESLAATRKEVLRETHGRGFHQMLKKLRGHPGFTAHPTEARRRAVVTAIDRVAVPLARRNDESASATARLDWP